MLGLVVLACTSSAGVEVSVVMIRLTMNSTASSKVEVAAHLAFKVILAALDWAVAAEELVAWCHKIPETSIMVNRECIWLHANTKTRSALRHSHCAQIRW